jgi:EAL domain-containing protein (putative c-di-GMP-specific phosphodiesterase class I)
VVAEGVETELQLTQLRWLGCEMGQGYYFSPPIAPQQLIDFLETHIPHWLTLSITDEGNSFQE